ncbi:hypothetical protein [Mucilaginibacter agri]|uniref:Outer membrane protein beta-barrel domain-containing protein n=1 Tax=Mucilaginibacter agri TaxID=2695265 RepID=A0A965ZJ97_9SPHI|nr:hypothetical protein [Mucilaginibacter agri]NCD71128.1 hypothetical protein [Mucilaginibacter agri]
MIVEKLFSKHAALVFALCIAISNHSRAQEAKTTEEPFKPNSELALVISHAHVFEGRNESGEKQTLSLPSWSIDYTYKFTKRWAIGLHTDVIVEKFKVENHSKDEESEEIERSYPVAPALVGIYKLPRHWSFVLGFGGEFASEGSYALTRTGVEYSAEISKGWEVFGTVSYDFKWNAYDTWATGIGIAKSFGSAK